MYAIRNEEGVIIGWSSGCTRITDKTPIDESSQEWIDYRESSPDID